MSDLRIEYVELDQLRRWPRNPKRHDDAGLDRSVERFGFVQPLTIDEGTGRLVAGHGRLDALVRLRDSGAEPPGRVLRSPDGGWLVPVIRGVAFASEEEAEAYLVADNSLVEAGGWDETLLGQILRDHSFDEDLGVFGWSDEDLDRLLEAGTPGAPVIPTTKPQAEPVIESEVYIEIRCSRADLEVFSGDLNRWGSRDGVSVHSSAS